MQKAQLFTGTIRSNLLWGNASASDEMLWQALETAQAADFVRSNPDGLDARVEQGGRNLSGGQKQRLTIARALVMQPDILIFNMWDPDTRWVGNEDGYAPMDNWNPVEDVDFSMLATEKEKLARTRFLPSECDFKLRSTWFDGGEANLDTIKDVEELVGIYEYSVGRGANFLINIGPDSRGLLPGPDAQRLLEFGSAIRRRYGTPLPQFGGVEQTGEVFGGDELMRVGLCCPFERGDAASLLYHIKAVDEA